MHPVLFTVDVAGRLVTVRAYGLFMTLATLAAVGTAFFLASRAGLPKKRTAVAVAVAVVAAFLGARLLNVALNRQFYESWSSVFHPSFSGLSLYGGLLLACALGWATAHALRVPSWRLLDAAVPAVAGGLVLARVGCFLNGCCFGRPTDLPWGVSYPRGSLAWAYDAAYGSLNLFGGSSAVHPTQLYEIGGVVIVAGLAMWWGSAVKSRRTAGTTFLIFAGGLSLVRLGVYFLRAPVFATQAPAWVYPLLYTVIVLGCAALVASRSRAGRPKASAPAVSKCEAASGVGTEPRRVTTV